MSNTIKQLTIKDVIHTDEYTIGCLSIPNANGDTATMWDTRDEASVAEVRATFDEMVKVNHMLAERVKESGGFSGEQIREFDPEAEVIVVHRPLVGG